MLRVLLPAQRSIAMISEMIHTASLVHDDVIDDSDTRRGKNTINQVWGERKVSDPSDHNIDARVCPGPFRATKVLNQSREYYIPKVMPLHFVK